MGSALAKPNFQGFVYVKLYFVKPNLVNDWAERVFSSYAIASNLLE
jgi:hypothetical protein